MAKKKSKVQHVKNPNAVALGRLGGRSGGPARSKTLGKQRREQIAREGGLARARQRKDEKKS